MEKQKETGRGFYLVDFIDDYNKKCSLQESSSIEPHIWLGVDDPEPQIMAKDAINLGITTSAVNGWVPYPIHEKVLLCTRMHLNREQVKDLIKRLKCWVNTGSFESVSWIERVWRRLLNAINK